MKSEFRTWVSLNVECEIDRTVRGFAKSKGVRGAEVLVEKIFRATPQLPEDGKNTAKQVIERLKTEPADLYEKKEQAQPKFFHKAEPLAVTV